MQPWLTPFPIWNQCVAPCPVLTVASWPAYRFLRRQARWSDIPNPPWSIKSLPQFTGLSLDCFSPTDKGEGSLILMLNKFSSLSSSFNTLGPLLGARLHVQFLVSPGHLCGGFPGDTGGKEPACQSRRHKHQGLIPASGRFPGGGNGTPLRYSFLENPMDKGACPQGHKESDMIELT